MKLWLFRSLLVGVIIIGTGLRFYQLKLSPPGLYVDETSIGYNAYSVLKTGKDEYGIIRPLFFRAFGEYKNPVFIYSLVPLVAINGLKPITIRLGAAIWGSLALPLLYLFIKEFTRDKWLSLIATIILGIMPWHVHYSRLGFEAITFPTLLLLALWFFGKWINSERIGWGLGFGFSLGLSFYSYTTARFWVPFIFFLLMLIFRKKLPKRQWLMMTNSLLLMFIPLISWIIKFPDSLMARMNQISIWADKPVFQDLWQRFSSTYLGHISYSFLFSRGDTTIRHSSGVSSEMLLSSGLFLILGLILIIKKLINQPFWQFTLIMILLFPLGASLTRTSPIASRTIQIVPFMALVIGLGFYSTVKVVKNKKLKYLWICFGLLLAGHEFNKYYLDLIYRYPLRVWQEPHGFAGDLPETIRQAITISQAEKKELYLSNKIDQAYIQGLFFTQSDPKIWQEKKQAKFRVEEPEEKLKKGVWVLIKKGNYKIINAD